jgi:hypothetical protein
VTEARRADIAFEQADEALPLASEMVGARRDAEEAAKGPLAIQAAKTATAKAEREQLHAEANYRAAQAKPMGVIGADCSARVRRPTGAGRPRSPRG